MLKNHLKNQNNPEWVSYVVGRLDELEHDLAVANKMIRLLTLLLVSEEKEALDKLKKEALEY